MTEKVCVVCLNTFLQMLLMKKNPYIWDISARQVNMPVLSVDMKDDDNNIVSVGDLNTPITLTIPSTGNRYIRQIL